jgi:hypothetical protein
VVVLIARRADSNFGLLRHDSSPRRTASTAAGVRVSVSRNQH